MPREVRVGSSGTCPVLQLGLCPAPGTCQENQLGRVVNSGHVTTLCRSGGGARLGRDAPAQRFPDDPHVALRAELGEDAGDIGLDADHWQARHHNLASAPRPATNAQTPGACSRSGYSCTSGSAPIGPAQARAISRVGRNAGRTSSSRTVVTSEGGPRVGSGRRAGGLREPPRRWRPGGRAGFRCRLGLSQVRWARHGRDLGCWLIVASMPQRRRSRLSTVPCAIFSRTSGARSRRSNQSRARRLSASG